MAEVAQSALRQKLDGLRIARPPVADIAQLAELFARLLEDRLRSVLHMRPMIRVESAVPQRQGAAMAHLPPASLIATTAIDNGFAGCAVLAPRFAFRLVEMMTGVTAPEPDSHAVTEGPTRQLTSIDKVLLQYPAAAMFGAFVDAMPSDPPPQVLAAFTKPVLTVDETTNDAEISDDADEGASGVDGLAITLSLTLSGPDDVFTLPIFIPLTTLDLLEGQRPSRVSAANNAPSIWSRTMQIAARTAGLRMVGVLHEKKLSIGDIRDMRVGSVIPLPPDHHMQIDLRIDAPNGVSNEPTIGGGVLGVVDGQRAVRLTAPPDEAFLAHLEILQP